MQTTQIHPDLKQFCKKNKGGANVLSKAQLAGLKQALLDQVLENDRLNARLKELCATNLKYEWLLKQPSAAWGYLASCLPHDRDEAIQRRLRKELPRVE